VTTHNPESLAETNAAKLQSELEDLQSRLWATPNYREFWAHVKEINQLFKALKPIAPESRQRLWADLSSVCQQAKRQQEREVQKRKGISEQKMQLVQSKLSEAYHQVKGSRSAGDLADAREMLNTALAWMKNGWSGFTATTELFALNDGRMTKSDHDACWQRWQEVNEALRARRREFAGYQFERFENEAGEAITLADFEPKKAKDRVKAIQCALRGAMRSREQFDQIRSLLDRAWEGATAKQQKHHEEWKSRQLSHVTRKRDLIEQMELQIEGLEGQIDHCRDLEAGARTDDYAQTIRGWIETKYDKISAKRRFIEELEEQIRSITEKMRD
jgi:hypothetical protein